MHGHLCQPPFGTGLHQVERLRPQPHHQNLALGVAKPGVIFHQPRLPILDHQPGIQHPLIGRAGLGQFGHAGRDDLPDRLCGNRVGQHRRGGIGPHAAGVGPGVAVKRPFVILRRADRQDRRAIDQYEKAGLLAFHELLNHHLGPGGPKCAAQHVVDCGVGLRQRHRHDHAFARGQPIRLDHNRCACGRDIGMGGAGFGKPCIGGGGGTGCVADRFCERFRRFQPGGSGRRSENCKSCVAQSVGDTGGQGPFGADDHEIHCVFGGKHRHRFAIKNVDIGAFGQQRDARIARRHDQPVAFRVLLDRPGQAVFPPAAAQYQDIHRLPPLGLLSWAS